MTNELENFQQSADRFFALIDAIVESAPPPPGPDVFIEAAAALAALQARLLWDVV